jgi:starch-binding outer membrane protein, SusD/RagB family
MYLDWGINPGPSLIRDQHYGGSFVGVKHNFTKLDRQTGNVSQGSWNEVSLINYNLMRFSDLLLMAAECEIEVGDPEKARSYVNQIRTRVNNSDVKNDGVNDASNYRVGLYTTPWTKNNFSSEAVRFERKLELGMEGPRFFDLIRWGADYALKELNQGYIPNEAPLQNIFCKRVLQHMSELSPYPSNINLLFI